MKCSVRSWKSAEDLVNEIRQIESYDYQKLEVFRKDVFADCMVIQSDELQNICSNRDRKCDNNTGAVPDYGERLFLLYRKFVL